MHQLWLMVSGDGLATVQWLFTNSCHVAGSLATIHDYKPSQLSNQGPFQGVMPEKCLYAEASKLDLRLAPAKSLGSTI